MSSPSLVMAQIASQDGVPFIGSGEGTICPKCPPQIESGLETLNRYVLSHYSFAANVGDWTVYRKVGAPGPP